MYVGRLFIILRILIWRLRRGRAGLCSGIKEFRYRLMRSSGPSILRSFIIILQGLKVSILQSAMYSRGRLRYFRIPLLLCLINTTIHLMITVTTSSKTLPNTTNPYTSEQTVPNTCRLLESIHKAFNTARAKAT